MKLNTSMIAGAALLSAGSLALSPIAFAKDAPASPAVSVTINDAGHVMVRNASVGNVSSSSVSATTAWGSQSFSWNVNLASTTQVLSANGGRMALADIKSGDKVSFQGALDTSAASLTVNAKVLRDLSATSSASTDAAKGEKRHMFEGKVQSINGSTVLIAQGKKTFTVNVSGSASAMLGSLKAGDRVLVTGTGTTTVNASKLRILSR